VAAGAPVPARARLNAMTDHDRISRATRILAGGRVPGLVVAFAIPLVLARVFDQAEFGTYKQLFLIYATLFGLAQLGMAESLYYFVPMTPARAGRHVANALVALGSIGVACVIVLIAARERIADWLTNAALATHLVPLSGFLALMLASAVFEIVLISRRKHGQAAWAYAVSDIVRAACFVIPALIGWGLQGVLAGAALFAATRLAAALVVLWREFKSELRVDLPVLRRQLAYALPFALAVGIEVLHINWHQYAVAARVDAAAFAIYAVGCLQIPVVDLIVMSTVNVMMVEMSGARERSAAAALRLWHDTIGRLAFMIFPLAAFLVLMAREIIVVLFTTTYEASVPIFMLWSLTMLASVLVVDGVLRVYAQTRYLVAQNALHLLIVAVLVGPFLGFFGLGGAVLVTLLATLVVRTVAVVRISRLMGVGAAQALPWKRLATAAICAFAATIPALLITRNSAAPPLASLILAALTYGLAYAALYYSIGRHTGAPILGPAATV
jgi:O-antigen/teichoic acid export membrane protein